MMTGLEYKSLFPFISEPTFSPRLTHHKSLSRTKGLLALLSCNFCFKPNHFKKSFMFGSL